MFIKIKPIDLRILTNEGGGRGSIETRFQNGIVINERTSLIDINNINTDATNSSSSGI